MLTAYAEQNATRYHMPGHKGSGSGILSDIYPYDITELSFSDNLTNPNGVIDNAEKDLASLVGAKRSRILTGGSTLGVLVSVFAAKAYYKGEKSKLIICKSSHKSVYNILGLLGIEPIFLPEKIIDGLPFPDLNNLPELCDNGVIGALFTSPDYFGRCLDLEKISKILKQNGKLLIVDGAHGAHMPFVQPELYAGRYSDIWVDGAHKTLKTLTQGALLCINNTALLDYAEEGLSIFSTSSPNYLITGSVEDGYKSFAELDKTLFEEVKKAKAVFGERLSRGYSMIKSDDILKLCVDLHENADGARMGEYLEKNNIYAELAAGRFLIFMLAPTFDYDSAKKLVELLNGYKESVKVSKIKNKECAPKRALPYVMAKKCDFEFIDLKDAKGRISAGEVGLFPPCFPLIVAGEVFDNRLIGELLNKNTFGIGNGKVKVVK